MNTWANTPGPLRLCTERLFDGSYHHGFVCCRPEGHEGNHAITNGTMDPPFSVVVREWPQASHTGEKK